MIVQESFTIEKTNAVRGVAALSVFLLHIIYELDISPFFNMWGGMFVGVFLILSGYGINESYHNNGLGTYWSKRLSKVVVPTLSFICVYSLLSPENDLVTFFKEITYQSPTYWFVFHILKYYAVYWFARRFCSRFWMLPLTAFALFCLNYRCCGIQLESEQAFSFLAGVLISERKSVINSLSEKKMRTVIGALFMTGLIFYLIKMIPAVHQYVGTVFYNYLLMPFRLSWALVALYILLNMPIAGSRVLQFCGKHSLELYIAHLPMIGMIYDGKSVVRFALLSLLSFSLLLAFKRIQPRLSLGITLYVFVNALFVAKYSARVTSLYAWITLGFMALHLVFIAFLLPVISRDCSRYKKCLIVFLAFLLLSMAVAQYAIDPAALNVDRWSAIHNFIDNLFKGIYPYSAQTHLGGYGSPFPVWQILHVPFYALHNVGLSFFAFLAVWAWAIRRYHGEKTALLCLCLIAISPAVWYEVAVRSDMLSNFLLLSAAVMFMSHSTDPFGCAMAILTGLLMSTRFSALIPLGMFLLPAFFGATVWKKILFPLIALAVFATTFLPFLLWDAESLLFFEYNPFVLQTRQGNLSDFLLFIPLGLCLSFQWKGSASYNRNVSLMFFALVTTTFVHNMVSGENYSLFSSAFDITYYTPILPFTCISLVLTAHPKNRAVWGCIFPFLAHNDGYN